ncbi:universal stress protein [Kitasatospora sp. NBC_01250]|uniref:universal stress protein n=1 Tax=Kitasatospora sp. NBC_01250 TaxID=2903571 RepID=UPI002E34D9BC|nr:universal stress protein [Kitasatospora sp. NBC_01250]
MTEEAIEAPRIVVGVDGSDSSKAALRWAVRQAELTGSAVEALTSWELPKTYGWPSLSAEVPDYEKDAGQALAETIRTAVGTGHPVEIRPLVVRGHAAAALLDAAHGATLLVVGNRGHGGFAEALLGSVSQQCVQHASCPVVVVRGPGS